MLSSNTRPENSHLKLEAPISSTNPNDSDDDISNNHINNCDIGVDVSLLPDKHQDTIVHVLDNELTTESNNASNLSSTDALGSRMVLNTFKAGMEDLDKEKINSIIQEASKGSKFYKNEAKKQSFAAERNEQLKNKMQALPMTQINEALRQVNEDITSLEMSCDLSKVIVHVDIDAFFAAVHMKEDPHLRDIPMAVGGNSMLSTSNYHARKFGVRAGMPGFIAKKLCPQLVIVSSSYSAYKAESVLFKSVLEKYDSEYCSLGLDEAYLNITEHLIQRIQSFLSNQNDESNNCKIFSGLDIHSVNNYWDRNLVERVVQEMRDQITEVTQLTASAGITPNKMLSKICSDMNKPNGQYFLSPERQKIIDFIRSLKVQKVCGIGKVTAETLRVLGIVTIQDMYEKLPQLKILMSDIFYNSFIRISLGVGSNDWSDKSERKSMSCERTFGEVSDPEELSSILLDLSKQLSHDLKRKDFRGSTITLKYKTVNFEVSTRATTIDSMTNSEDIIYKYVNKLFRKELESVKPHSLKLRLMGVRMSGFQKNEEDFAMDQEASDQSNSKRRKLKHIDLNATNTISDFFNSNSNNAEHFNYSNYNYVASQFDKAKDIPCNSSNRSVSISFRNSQLQKNIMESLQNTENSSSIINNTSLPISDAATSQDEPLQNTCPICFLQISGDNSAINKHIDTCLNLGSNLIARSNNNNNAKSKASLHSKQNTKYKPTSKRISNSQPSLKSFFSPT